MRLVLVTCVLLLLAPAAARAAWQPPRPLDGANPAVVGLGGVSVARDGTGAVGYLRTDGVWVARLSGGAWGAPGQLDPAPGTDVKVAAGDGDRLAVAWISGGVVRATVAAAGAFAAPTTLGGPGAENLDLDIGVDGVAYAVWEQGGDVRAARLLDTTWTTLAAPLDIVAAAPAGTGALRPRVAVDAAGNALVVWGEAAADGLTHVYARRLIGTAQSAYPRDASLPGGNADSADVSTEYDGNFEWVVFREDAGGVTHTFARHFLGSTFDPAVQLDGGLPSDSPRVSLDGAGDGAAVFNGAGNQALSPVLAKSVFAPAQRLDSGSAAPTAPDVSATDNGNVAAVWLASGLAHGRFLEPGKPYQADTLLSDAARGPVADPGVQIAGDRVGDYVAAFVQGPAGARTLSVSEYDRPPGRPAVAVSTAYHAARPRLSWRAGLDLWGGQTFRVLIDGALAGTTQAQALVPRARLKTGWHTYRIVAVDQAGQATPSHTRRLRVDGSAPRVQVAISGPRAAGSVLRVGVRARDRGGSGLGRVTVAFGDGHSARGASVSHVYRRRGNYTLTASAADRAGNVGRRTVRIRIR